MALPYLPSDDKESAWHDVVYRLCSLPLIENSVDVGPGDEDDTIGFVCRRGMAATLELVNENIERLTPWRDVVILFMSDPVESVPKKRFFPDAGDDEVITRDNVMCDLSEPGDELIRMISAKGALEHAITLCDGQWGWTLRDWAR